jgi:hypothetical protein
MLGWRDTVQSGSPPERAGYSPVVLHSRIFEDEDENDCAIARLKTNPPVSGTTTMDLQSRGFLSKDRRRPGNR